MIGDYFYCPGKNRLGNQTVSARILQRLRNNRCPAEKRWLQCAELTIMNANLIESQWKLDSEISSTRNKKSTHSYLT
jgi:hypothetical protein